MATSVLRPLRVVIALTLLALARPALAQQLVLSWIPSTSSGVSGYRVYLGDVGAASLGGTAINLGNPAVVGGVASAAITIDRSRAWAAEMTAYGSNGAESARSNRVTFAAATSEGLGAAVYRVDFSGAAVGTRPVGYLDPTNAFRIAAQSDGNRTLSTSRPSAVAVARYVGPSVTTLGAYELSGRISLAAAGALAGVGVRVPVSDLSQAFTLGVSSSGVFALSQAGKAPLRCASSTSTGVSWTGTGWYRFRLRYTNPSGRARLRAKVWPGSGAEPSGWQADCWTDVAVAAGSGAFALYRNGIGIANWDDLAVQPVTGTLDPIP